MRLTFVRFLVAMGLSWPMAALASDIAVTGHAAGWTAFTGVANNGIQVCGIFEAGHDGRSFHVKSFDGQDYLVVQIFKPGWTIPRGTQIPASIQFAGFSPWSVVAVGIGNMIEFKVPTTSIGPFASQFRAADQFRLTFLAGNEGTWSGQLAGSAAAMDMLGRCVAGRRGGSQPFDSPSPAARSQPLAPAPSTPAGSPRISHPWEMTV